MLKSNFSTKKMQSALYVILLLAVIAMMMSIKRCSSRHSIKIAPQTGIVTIDSITHLTKNSATLCAAEF